MLPTMVGEVYHLYICLLPTISRVYIASCIPASQYYPVHTLIEQVGFTLLEQMSKRQGYTRVKDTFFTLRIILLPGRNGAFMTKKPATESSVAQGRGESSNPLQK